MPVFFQSERQATDCKNLMVTVQETLKKKKTKNKKTQKKPKNVRGVLPR